MEYKVQSQLNAVNKEKVVGELEDATTKVNNEMSSLYWSYVSQEVDKVRGQFDKILNKEIAFQKTMVAFYKPNSKDLAGELNDQKKILQQIQDNVNKAEKGSSDRQGDVEQVEKNLNSFIEYVNQYQTYQETQKQMLEKTQAQSVAAIQQGLSSLESNQPSSKQNFNEQANQVFSGLSSIQQQLDENQKAVGELGDQQADNVSEQEKALQDLNGQIVSSYKQQSEQTTLNQIESKLKPLRAQLETASSNEGAETQRIQGKVMELSQTLIKAEIRQRTLGKVTELSQILIKVERPRRILEKMTELSQIPVKAKERQNQFKWIYLSKRQSLMIYQKGLKT